MKIAYFVNEYPKVSHSFIRREIHALERRGFSVQRIALRGWDTPVPDEEDRREREKTQYVLRKSRLALLGAALAVFFRAPVRFLETVRLALRMSRDSDRPWIYHLFYMVEACAILPWLRASGALRIHAHFGTNSTDVVTLAHALGGPPYSFTVHGPDEFFRAVGLREKIHRADFVVAISSFGRSQLCMWTPHQQWSKIKVVHCGLEKGFYDGAPALPAMPAPRLVCVGHLAEAKGHLLLVEAAARIAAAGITFELVFAGDGPLRPEIEALIAQYRLSERVRITGWISGQQVRDEILAARALVLPSFAEGLPVVIMESMALYRPVISTYVAGIPELVQPGENGWLVPAGSVEELARAIEACLSEVPQKLQQMGELSHRRAVARHSIDTEAGKLAELFRLAGVRG
jgi:colanic acid/amylovoran biosynthesis glycosyltransferase